MPIKALTLASPSLASPPRSAVVNAAIRAGAVGALKPGPEAAYAAALQAFTTEHGRLIAGATGQNSDAARDQAQALVTGTQAPEAVKAALNQIVNKELPVLKNSSEQAIGLMANRAKYPGINKISEKLGYSLDTLVPPPTAAPQNAAPAAHPGQSATPSKPSTGWGKAMKTEAKVSTNNPGDQLAGP